MTNPTTDELLAWLDDQITYSTKSGLPKYLACAQTIRAQLLAGREAVKCGEKLIKLFQPGQIMEVEYMRDALTAAKEAGII